MTKVDWEIYLHRVADRVAYHRGRAARMRWPAALVRRIDPRRIDWRHLVTRAVLGRVVRRGTRALATLALVGVIASGGFRVVQAVRAEPPKPQAPKAVNVYYFDLGTEKLYVASSDSPLPMKPPSGGAGPQRHAGRRPRARLRLPLMRDANDRFIGYIESADTPPEKTASKTAPGIASSVHYVSKPQADSEWYPATSPSGLSIANAAQTKCGPEKTPKYCTP